MTTSIDRSVPVDNQEWRRHLVLVSSVPSRFVGVVTQEEYEKALAGQPFVLTDALVYFANYQMQPRPTGYALIVAPHELLPYDLVSHLNKLTITNCQHIVRVADQPPALADWICTRYMDHYDPPRVVTDKLLVG